MPKADAGSKYGMAPAIDAAGRFLDQWGSLAVEFQWKPADLFDVPRDGQSGGLVWFLQGEAVRALGPDHAVTTSGRVFDRIIAQEATPTSLAGAGLQIHIYRLAKEPDLMGRFEDGCFWPAAIKPSLPRHARRQFRLDVLVAPGARVHHRFKRFMDFADRTALHPASVTLVEDRLVGFCSLGQQGRRWGARIVVPFFH